MKRSLFIIVLLFDTSLIIAQEKDCFINNFIREYNTKKDALCLDEALFYVPSIMNFVENLSAWDKLSVSERQSCFWSFLQSPILANDFAIDLSEAGYYFFPEGWLYHNRNAMSTNRIVFLKHYPPSIGALLEYLKHNKVDYIFSIVNIGDYYGSNYWVIKDNQLFVLLYEEETNRLNCISADEFMIESSNFRTPLE